jgi:DNA-binding NtrC family response regulator
MISDGTSPQAAQAVAKPLLLLVDDDPLITDSLRLLLGDEYEVLTAPSRDGARQVLDHAPRRPALALVDLGLPPRPHVPDEGFALVHDLLALYPGIRVLILSGQDDEAAIRRALTLGAVDFIPKPCDTQVLKGRLRHQVLMLRAEAALRAPVPDWEILGESAPLRALRQDIRQLAGAPFPLLIEGESGTGKEMVARSLHEQSPRARAPYLTLNCAAFTPELLEAQLFGHAKGAYTGAHLARAGFFEEAGEGTLLLDEIGEMPLPLQAKLLRALENGEYYRLGEAKPRICRARILASTNRDLRAEVASGRFRGDLYHRLSVLSLRVPALRERASDIPLLFEHFRQTYGQGSAAFSLAPEAPALLLGYGFPGNVRELRNVVIRLAAKYPGGEVSTSALARELSGSGYGAEGAPPAPLDTDFNLDERLAAQERSYIEAALQQAEGNLTRAARLLGINRTTLYSRMQRLGMKDRETG